MGGPPDRPVPTWRGLLLVLAAMAAIPVFLAAVAVAPVFTVGVLGGWLLRPLVPRGRRATRRGAVTTYRTLDRFAAERLPRRFARTE